MPVNEVMTRVLDRMEHAADNALSLAPDRPLSRTGTGVAELDEVLEGGLVVGRVAVAAVDDTRLARAVITAVCRWCPVPVLAAVPDPVAAGRRVLAAEASLPEQGLCCASLPEALWQRLPDAVGRVADLDLAYVPAQTLEALVAACTGEFAVVVVDVGPGLGAPARWLPTLSWLAQHRRVAVMAVTTAPAERVQAVADPAVSVVLVTRGSRHDAAVVVDPVGLRVRAARFDGATATFGTAPAG